MNEKLKELAVQAGLITNQDVEENNQEYMNDLERFAELILQNYVSQIMTTEDRERFIRDDERAKCASDYLQDCCDAVDAARLEEREACAVLCDDWFASTAGQAIRDRGAK
jgi:hypothetical protein